MSALLDPYNSNVAKLLLKGINSVQEGISMIDEDGYIRYINKAACKILGIKPEDILNQKAELFAPNPLLIQILNKQEPIIDIEYFMDFNGKTIHLINSGYPIFNEDKAIVGAIDIFRGIQRSRKLANNIAGMAAVFTFDQIVGKSIELNNSIRLAKIYSKNNENILLMGESGTGKDLFAQSIHNHSSRRAQPFIALNCANFPNELIDTELFGYDEGAFTGALKGGKPGKFEAANGGTLFLDEVSEIPIHLQAKLLRVIETKTINRLGNNKPIFVDVKIIAATNRNLENFVDEGCFRKDLYFRLKVFFLEIPPLRERGQDVILLAEYFVKKLENKITEPIKHIEKEAIELLLKYSWPGNVRELEHLIARSLVICENNSISAMDLHNSGLKIQIKEIAPTKVNLSRRYQKKQILDALSQTKGNKKLAAEMLGISRPTLYKILAEEDLPDPHH